MFEKLMGLGPIAPKELYELIQRKAVTVIDVNSVQSWSQSHVPGALLLDPNQFEQSDLPSDLETVLVFYCSNPLCRKAPNAARRAKKMGYRDVRVMSAGISGWLAAQLPTES